MGIIKLQNAGESVTWHIAGAEVVKGQYGEQVKFDNDAGETLYLPLDSANRQLDRIGLTVVECVGNVLTISRDPNPKPGSKPFWGIRLAGPAQPASKRLPPPSEKPQPFDEPTEDERFERFSRAVDEASGDVDEPYAPPAPAPVVNGTADQTQRAVNQYASVYGLMDKALQKAYGAKVPPDTVQAATFSVWKRLSDKGVL